jgi:hypothetical protein
MREWNYPRGNANSNTTKLVAEYYGRLLSWMTKGTRRRGRKEGEEGGRGKREDYQARC